MSASYSWQPSVSACFGWLENSGDGVMQQDELFPFGVAQPNGWEAALLQSSHHNTHPRTPTLDPLSSAASPLPAGRAITSPDEMGFPNKRSDSFSARC
jgi:hypothetical protein